MSKNAVGVTLAILVIGGAAVAPAQTPGVKRIPLQKFDVVGRGFIILQR